MKENTFYFTNIYLQAFPSALYERANAPFYITVKCTKRSSAVLQSDKASVSPFRGGEGTRQTFWDVA